MSPSPESALAEKVAVVQNLAVLHPPVVILLKRIHHIQLTSREAGDSRNQMDEKDSQITHHTIPTRVRNPRNARKLGIRQRQDRSTAAHQYLVTEAMTESPPSAARHLAHHHLARLPRT